MAVVLGLGFNPKEEAMLSKIIKRAKGWLVTVAFFAALANKDWENFFPLSSHSDLRFQIIGESLEILALVGLFALGKRLSPRVEKASASASSRTGPAIFSGAMFPALLFVMFWRDYFPNDAFKFGEVLRDLGYASIAGVVIALFALIPPAKQGKPSKEEERSVV